MTIRITDNMRYNTTVGNLFTIQRQYNEVMEKLASQKRINKLSDDALGSSQLVDFKKTQHDITGYRKNADDALSWLSMTESTLTGANDLLVKAGELAVSQSSASANASSRKIAAQNVQALYDQLLSLANTKLGDRYLFAGSQNDAEPFTGSRREAGIDAPTAAAGNGYAGKVTAAGTYSGERNNTYVIKIIEGGAEDTATFSISRDGGKTWDAKSAPGAMTGPIDVGDGVSMTFTPGTFATGDIFYVNASAPGYYRGNGDDLSVALGKDTAAVYNVTGEAAFTDRGPGKVDVFQTLADLKAALENNKPGDVAAQLDKLEKGREQINLAISKCGTAANRMEMTKNSLEKLSENMTTMIADIEDADIAGLATQVAAKQVALQACYEVAARIQNNTILNFLK
ncbi:MAG TPA: flagellar hook-associated protein FlgL [Syntrophales bacterium]|nr:flagellar hook-associated protein FlgL [Syntrophales bacterium]